MGKMTRLKQSKVFHNRYKIESVIGKGGMGTVYLAKDCRLKGKEWAIKEIQINEESNQKFVDEAKMLINLEHPYLPKIVDYYYSLEEGYSYLVMEYIKGSTLKDIFEDKGYQLVLDKILKYSLQICNLFDYLHNKQKSPVVYRDLKPVNIMIDEYDNVKLIDFGIARKYNKEKNVDTVQMGTVGFAAPEQFENKQTDQRTDIYSFGSLIYYLLSNGKYYYLTQKPINYFRNDLSEPLIDCLNKMLKYNPDERYQNILSVKKILEEFNQNMIGVTEKLTVTEKDFENNKSPMKGITYQGTYTNNSSKQVMIANLSKKAGSTFLTLNLAKCISEYNIFTSVIEIPFEPYIFDYLGINQKTNKSFEDFYSFPHEIINNNRLVRGRDFHDDAISWIITDPRKPKIDSNNWTYNHMLKLLYSCRKANITIIDVGDNINHQSIEMILDEMDLILIVVDPMPSDVILNYSRIEYLLKKKESGLPIEFVINKLTKNIPINDLIDVLGVEPITYIQNIELDLIHKAVYSCKIPYNYKDVSIKLEKSFNRILSNILPQELFK